MAQNSLRAKTYLAGFICHGNGEMITSCPTSSARQTPVGVS